jgi:hypothetical protein
MMLLVFCGLPALAAAVQIPSLKWKERSDWINVMTDVRPGAMGDGVADDTAALQAAFDKAGGNNGGNWGKVIYLPPGTYKISATLTWKDSVGGMLIGHGRETTLQWESTTGDVMFRCDSVRYSQVIGLTFDGNYKANVGLIQFNTLAFSCNNRYQHLAFYNLEAGTASYDAGIVIGPQG